MPHEPQKTTRKGKIKSAVGQFIEAPTSIPDNGRKSKLNCFHALLAPLPEGAWMNDGMSTTTSVLPPALTERIP